MALHEQRKKAAHKQKQQRFSRAKTKASTLPMRSTEAASMLVHSEAAGIQPGLAVALVEQTENKIRLSGSGRLVNVRFLPSTRVNVPGGFQVLANATVQSGKRVRALNTTIIIEGADDHQSVKKLKIQGL